MHAHTCTRTHTHARTNARAHNHLMSCSIVTAPVKHHLKFLRIPIHIMYTIHIHIYTFNIRYICVYTDICKYVYIYIFMYIHAYIYICIHTYILMYISIYTHVYKYKYMHTYVYINIIWIWCFLPSEFLHVAFVSCIKFMPHIYTTCTHATIDWCCFYYFVRNSLAALLKALCAQDIHPCSYFVSLIYTMCVCYA